MSGDISKYIGHNQWDGLNFDKFYNKAITGDYEKIILFCQNEWAWHVQGDPVLFEKLQSFCEENNKMILYFFFKSYAKKLNETMIKSGINYPFSNQI